MGRWSLRYAVFVLDPAEIVPETPRLLSRDAYQRMIALGMFEGERVELLYGTIVRMSPHGPRGYRALVVRVSRVYWQLTTLTSVVAAPRSS